MLSWLEVNHSLTGPPMNICFYVKIIDKFNGKKPDVCHALTRSFLALGFNLYSVSHL